jgi:hypothetical protein
VRKNKKGKRSWERMGQNEEKAERNRLLGDVPILNLPEMGIKRDGVRERPGLRGCF